MSLTSLVAFLKSHAHQVVRYTTRPTKRASHQDRYAMPTTIVSIFTTAAIICSSTCPSRRRSVAWTCEQWPHRHELRTLRTVVASNTARVDFPKTATDSEFATSRPMFATKCPPGPRPLHCPLMTIDYLSAQEPQSRVLLLLLDSDYQRARACHWSSAAQGAVRAGDSRSRAR